MTARQPKFPWSDQKIRDALGWHAIPYEDDEEIIRALAEVGAKHIMDRRSGGRKPKTQSTRSGVRRILVSVIFTGAEKKPPDLPPRFRRTPTSPRTIRKVCEILGQKYGWTASEATILKDVKKLGSRNLRQK
jgi:hypothetical protein